MEMDADATCAVETGSEGEALAETAVLAGAGDEDTLAADTAAELLVKAKLVGLNCKGHGLPSSALLN